MSNYEKSAMAMAKHHAEILEQLFLDGKDEEAKAEFIRALNHIRQTFTGIARKKALSFLANYYLTVKVGKELSV